jgi:type IV pilus assembly protein PilE
MCVPGVSKVIRRSSGFTLIEMMMAVAVVGILAAIAFPAYTEYIRRSELPEAFNTLADYHNKMEQYFFDNKKYGAGGDCANDASANQWNTFPRTVKYFTFDCALGDDGQSYTLTADGATGSAVGHTYTLDQSNRKSTTQFKGSSYSGNSCWFSKTAACD